MSLGGRGGEGGTTTRMKAYHMDVLDGHKIHDNKKEHQKVNKRLHCSKISQHLSREKHCMPLFHNGCHETRAIFIKSGSIICC